jgi:hypothetical protein
MWNPLPVPAARAAAVGKGTRGTGALIPIRVEEFGA